MSVNTDLALKITKKIKASAKDIFEAWLDPQTLKQFMKPGEGMTVPVAEVDAREGGNYKINMQAGEDVIPHSGEYKTIDKYSKLAFTWVSPFSQEGSLVTLTFNELSANETELTLEHVGFPNEESRKSHEGGWAAIVEVLASIL